MRSTRELLLGLLLLVSGASALSAQGPLQYNQRVRFTAPPVALDSSTIEMRVVDAATGAPVEALVCFVSGSTVVTDRSGAVRASGLNRTNVPVQVIAQGYTTESVIFWPGYLGRSFATVALLRGETGSVRGCGDAEWPA